MGSIGETLRRARLAKNITIDEIVAETKIRSRYIQAMEDEEWDIFPGVVYLKGFLRTYCQVLGVDEQEILESLAQDIKPEPEVQPIPQKIELPGRPRKRVGIIIGILAIILLIAFQYVYQNFINQPIPGKQVTQSPEPGQNTSETPQHQPVDQPGIQPPATPEEPVEEQPVTTGISMRLQATQGKCWIRIRDQGNQIFEGTLNRGEEKVFNDLTEIDVVFGNAGGIKYYLNGQDYGSPGAVGQVVTKKYRLENNEIIELTI